MVANECDTPWSGACAAVHAEREIDMCELIRKVGDDGPGPESMRELRGDGRTPRLWRCGVVDGERCSFVDGDRCRSVRRRFRIRDAREPNGREPSGGEPNEQHRREDEADRPSTPSPGGHLRPTHDVTSDA